MKQFFYLLAVAVFVTSCTQPFKKAKDGSQYKVVKSNSGKKAVPGNYIELYTIAKYKDSLLGSTYEDGMPQYILYDTAQFPPVFKEIFKDVSAGDSIVLKISADSLINTGRGAPFMKKGNFIVQYFRISNVFTTKEQADSVAKTHMVVAKARAYKRAFDEIQKQLGTTFAPQMKIDEQILTDYLNKKGITAAKTPWGTFVAVAVPGSGVNLSEKNVAVVNYTGKTLQDSVFDSNVDPKYGHVEPLNVDMGQYSGIIPGWIDGLKMLKKGSKATILIPSSLAYGKSGRQGIKPNENLAFDIEVIDIITPEQNESMQMARQQAQMNMQQKMQQMQEEAAKQGQKGGGGSGDKK